MAAIQHYAFQYYTSVVQRSEATKDKLKIFNTITLSVDETLFNLMQTQYK